MPATATITRPSHTNSDTIDAPTYNSETATAVTVPDADVSSFGVIKIAGDFEGTAAAPAIKTSLLSTAMRAVTAAASVALARTALGLGNAAQLNVGTTAGTVAAGDDPRIVSPGAPAPHTHVAADVLDLGNSATRNVGTTAGTVAAGDDSRFKAVGTTAGTVCAGDDTRLSNARTPTAHTHPTTDITGLGNSATRNVGSTSGTVCAGDDGRLSDARTPTAHTHVAANVTDLGNAATKNVGSTAGTVCAGDDSRLANSRQCNNSFDTPATARSNLGVGSNALGNRTVSTSAPSGGSDGDLWLRV